MTDLLERVDQRRDHDQVGDHVEDHEPPLGVGRVALRAGLGGAAQKDAQAPTRQARSRRARKRAADRTDFTGREHSWLMIGISRVNAPERIN